VGQAAEGVENDLLGAAPVGEDAAVVDLGHRADVPGVGRLAGAALAHVAGEPFQGGGAQQVDLRPGGPLDAVDRAAPRMGAVRASVASASFDERPWDHDERSPVVDALDAGGVDGGEGENGAVVEAPPAGTEGAVDEEAVAGAVVPLPRCPAR